jgi:hypothetical protein
MSTETKTIQSSEQKKLHFEWLLPIFLHPRKTIKQIIEQDKPVWLTPLLVLSGLAVISSLIAWPIKRDAIINGLTLPTDFQYYSTDQQAQYLNAQATQSSVLFTFIFPVLGALVGIWLTWFLMSSILHMSHFISGSSAGKHGYFNLVAWAMAPLMVREVVRILSMLFTHSAITAPGLSGFVTASTGGAGFLAGILAQIDIFFIWEVILLLVGVIPLSGLSRAKSWGATALTLVIMVLLLAIPHLLSGVISGVSSGSSTSGTMYG